MDLQKLLILTILLTVSAIASPITTILNKENSILIEDTITPVSIFSTQMQLMRLEKLRKGNSPIYLVINSPGGHLDSALNLIKFAESFENIHTICIKCASAAALLVESIKGKRYAVDESEIMFHEPRAGLQGYVTMDDLLEIYNTLKNLNDIMARMITKRIKMPFQEFKKRIKSDWTLSAKEALKLNMFDQIINIRCDKEDLLTSETKFCPFT